MLTRSGLSTRTFGRIGHFVTKRSSLGGVVTFLSLCLLPGATVSSQQVDSTRKEVGPTLNVTMDFLSTFVPANAALMPVSFHFCKKQDRPLEACYYPLTDYGVSGAGSGKYYKLPNGKYLLSGVDKPGKWTSDKCVVVWKDVEHEVTTGSKYSFEGGVKLWTSDAVYVRMVQVDIARMDPLSLAIGAPNPAWLTNPLARVVSFATDASADAIKLNVERWEAGKQGHPAHMDSVGIRLNRLHFLAANLEVATRMQNAFTHLLKLCKARVSTPF
jgi:hypothetical protein